jgi:hypothetical protein
MRSLPDFFTALAWATPSRPSDPSTEKGQEPGFGQLRGRFLAKTKFSSQWMLAAKRKPMENMRSSLGDAFPSVGTFELTLLTGLAGVVN